MHPKVVSERLGHASIGITLDAYSHVMPGMQEEAVEKIDAGLRAALAKESGRVYDEPVTSATPHAVTWSAPAASRLRIADRSPAAPRPHGLQPTGR